MKLSENMKVEASKTAGVTLLDVAGLAGTSPATASRALNGKNWVAPQRCSTETPYLLKQVG